MGLVFITDSFAIDPAEVSSVEFYEHERTTPSGGTLHAENGTIVVQKNGRKTYLRGVTPQYVYARLEALNDPVMPEETEEVE